MTSVLIVVSAADGWTLNDGSSHPTGYWGEELAEPGAPEGYMPHAVDPVSAARLWEWSEREVGQAAIGR